MSRARCWCFTLNNPSENAVAACLQLVEDKKVKYIIVGKEVGESGTPHLQGFVQLLNPKGMPATKRLLPGNPHLESMKGTHDQAIEYCEKDGDFQQAGERPMSQKKKGEVEIARWDTARQAAKEGRFDDIPSDIYMRCMNTVKKIHFEYVLTQQQQQLDELLNEWRWGPSGCGKSRSCREHFPILFNKPLNKWWDGYNGEETVLIEDVDPSHEKWIAHFLKMWGDHYPIQAEIKGGVIQVRPQRILVTSQYSIEQCFQDQKTVEALKRRYKSIHMC